MLAFNKIKKGSYTTNITAELLEKANKLLEDMSLGRSNDFLDVNNESIKNTILARMIASEFSRHSNLETNDVGFTLIKVEGLGYKLTVSIGHIENNEGKVKTLSGVYYTL